MGREGRRRRRKRRAGGTRNDYVITSGPSARRRPGPANQIRAPRAGAGGREVFENCRHLFLAAASSPGPAVGVCRARGRGWGWGPRRVPNGGGRPSVQLRSPINQFRTASSTAQTGGRTDGADPIAACLRPPITRGPLRRRLGSAGQVVGRPTGIPSGGPNLCRSEFCFLQTIAGVGVAAGEQTATRNLQLFISFHPPANYTLRVAPRGVRAGRRQLPRRASGLQQVPATCRRLLAFLGPPVKQNGRGQLSWRDHKAAPLGSKLFRPEVGSRLGPGQWRSELIDRRAAAQI